jgi:hypothetical protein
MLRAVALVLCLAGCDRVLGLKERPLAEQRCTPMVGDEDGDCLANGDDSCPAVVDVLADADRDAIDDACDPEVGVAHQLVEFEPFDDRAAAAMRWRDASASTPWRFEAGYAEHDDTNEPMGLLQRTAPFAGSEVTFAAGFRFTAWAAGVPEDDVDDLFLALRVDGDADQATGHECRLDPKGAAEVSVVVEDTAGRTSTMAVASPQVEMVIRMRLRRTADALACTVVMGDAAPVEVTLPRAGTPWPGAGRVAVDAARTAVLLDHATIHALQ